MFVGNARCYHTMDWYRSAQQVCRPRQVVFATDLIESEGHTRIVRDSDDIVPMYIIDRLLSRSQSRRADVWRNIVKLILIPVQVMRLKQITKQTPAAVYHAHTMYYMLVCWLAGLRFVGTPQGSEILVRPLRSWIYRVMASKALRAAESITVDSVAMQAGVERLSQREAVLVQNGIDMAALAEAGKSQSARTMVASIRGFSPLYRIDAIVEARDRSRQKPPLSFCYPLWDETYRSIVKARFGPHDTDLGRLERQALYDLFAVTLLAVSIPASDSSPRTVYEAIFCGCCVAATEASWISAIPPCMRERVVLIDLKDPLWLEHALDAAVRITNTRYLPSDSALDTFDQRRSMERVVNELYWRRDTPPKVGLLTR